MSVCDPKTIPLIPPTDEDSVWIIQDGTLVLVSMTDLATLICSLCEGGETGANAQFSIEGDGTAANPFQLVGDIEFPGGNWVYGTDAVGNRVWKLGPTPDEVQALAGTDGTPSAGNTYVTDSDPRNTNEREPVPVQIVTEVDDHLDMVNRGVLVNTGSNLKEFEVQNLGQFVRGDRIVLNAESGPISIIEGASVNLGIAGQYNGQPLYVPFGFDASLLLYTDSGGIQTWILEGDWSFWEPEASYEAVWDPDSLLATLSDSDPVTSWIDDVGGLDAAQGTGANQPTFTASDVDFNDLPTVDFDGTDDFLQLSDAGDLDADTVITMLCVFKRDAAGEHRILSKLTTGADPGYVFGVAATGDTLNPTLISDGPDPNTQINSSGGAGTDLHVLAVALDGGNGVARWASTVTGITDVSTILAGSASSAELFTIGAYPDATNPFNGRLGVSAIDTRTPHTQEQLNLALRAMVAKYGL